MQQPRKIQTVHVEKLDGELSVYDWERKEVHNLNPTAARVWELCDGQTAPTKMAETLQTDLDTPYAEDLVWLTLDELEQAHLLESKVVQPANRTLMTRRNFFKLGAAAAVPVVVSMVAPRAVHAQTPGITVGTWRPGTAGADAGEGFFDDLTLSDAQIAADAAAACPGGGVPADSVESDAAECAAVAAAADADFYRWGSVVGGANCVIIACNV
jgi:hypothetical protein